MSQFTQWTSLDLRADDDDENKWFLIAPIVWEVGALGSGDIITVPAGFRTDLASVPRPLWSIIPPFGRHAAAAVLHDYLYSTLAGRAFADRQFYEAMKARGVSEPRARIMYLGVRVGGWKRYREVSSQAR